MAHERCAGGERSALGGGEGVGDFGFDAGLELLVTKDVEFAGSLEATLEVFDGVAFAPGEVFGLGAVTDVVVETRAAVFAPAVGFEFEEDGTLAGARVSGGCAGEYVDGEGIVAIALMRGDPVAGGELPPRPWQQPVSLP